MTQPLFIPSNLPWQTLAGIDHLHYVILDVDEANKSIDVIFKFAAHQQIILHRHKALNKMFVIQGEHRLYEADGSLREIRPTGCYTTSPASEVPHREGGGETDAIVYFSIRGSTGVLYEILDDDLNIIGSLDMQAFIGLYQQQVGVI